MGNGIEACGNVGSVEDIFWGPQRDRCSGASAQFLHAESNRFGRFGGVVGKSQVAYQIDCPKQHPQPLAAPGEVAVNAIFGIRVKDIVVFDQAEVVPHFVGVGEGKHLVLGEALALERTKTECFCSTDDRCNVR